MSKYEFKSAMDKITPIMPSLLYENTILNTVKPILCDLPTNSEIGSRKADGHLIQV